MGIHRTQQQQNGRTDDGVISALICNTDLGFQAEECPFTHIPPSKETFVFSALCSPASFVCDIPGFGKLCYVDVCSNKNDVLN